MLEREVPCFGTGKSTVVGGSSTNFLRKVANATTWGTSVTRVTTRSNHSSDATTRTEYARDS